MKTTVLQSSVTALDLMSIIGNLDVGESLFVTNDQTARNVLSNAPLFLSGRFNVEVFTDYPTMERIA